jgi:hypothetical protein
MIKRTIVGALSVGFLWGCGGGSSSSPVPNTAPSLEEIGALTIQEGSIAVKTISASDPQNDGLTFSIASGEDKDLFSISAGGALAFLSAPDFEAAADANADNVYQVTVQVSDGSLSDSEALQITVTDAFEGRVVDAPIKGASVFIDLNDNGVQDEAEPAGVTDDDGFFNVAMFTLTPGSSAKVVSKGGTDTLTGEALPNLALISDVPADITKPANVTPLTTVLAVIETEQEKADLLAAMGIEGTPEALLTSDAWAAAAEGDTAAQATQRINQQVGLLLQTGSSLIDGTGGGEDVSIALAKGIAAEIKQAVVSQTGLDLSSPTALQAVLTDALDAVAPEAGIAATVLAAVADSVAVVNAVVADPTLDPLSDVAADIVRTAQDSLQGAVKDLVAGEVSVDDFTASTGPTTLFERVTLPANAPDTDGDGIADALDVDDDGDGVNDGVDAFPKDATETKDADNDGLGDNVDDFIPGNFDEAFFDEFDWS